MTSQQDPGHSGAAGRAIGMQDGLRQVIEKAENEALRSSRVLAVLDVKRARSCTELAHSARDVMARIDAWSEPSTTRETRREDTAEFQRVLEAAARLGLTSWG